MDPGICADCQSRFDRDTHPDTRLAHVGFHRSRCLDCLGRLLEARVYPDLYDDVLPAVRTGVVDQLTSLRIGVWRWDYRSWVWGVTGRALGGGPIYEWGALGTPEGDEDFCRDGRWRFGSRDTPCGLWEVAAADLRPFFRRARLHVDQTDARRRAARLDLPA